SQIIAYDIWNSGFVSYLLEDQVDNPVCVTWDGAFLEEVSCWWENEWSDSDIVYVGKKLGLNDVEKVLKSLNSTPDGAGFATFTEKEAWISRMQKELKAWRPIKT